MGYIHEKKILGLFLLKSDSRLPTEGATNRQEPDFPEAFRQRDYSVLSLWKQQ